MAGFKRSVRMPNSAVPRPLLFHELFLPRDRLQTPFLEECAIRAALVAMPEAGGAR